MDYTKELSKVMNQTVFTYRGVICERLIGGFRVLGHTIKNASEIDSVIDKSIENLKSSVISSQEGRD